MAVAESIVQLALVASALGSLEERRAHVNTQLLHDVDKTNSGFRSLRSLHT